MNIPTATTLIELDTLRALERAHQPLWLSQVYSHIERRPKPSFSAVLYALRRLIVKELVTPSYEPYPYGKFDESERQRPLYSLSPKGQSELNRLRDTYPR